MSKEVPEDFHYIVLFAALSGQSFTKTDLGIKMSVAQIKRLNEKAKLLEEIPKGRSLHLKATPAARRWAGEHLRMDLGNKRNKTLKVLEITLNRLDAYLSTNHISIETFLNLIAANAKPDTVEVTPGSSQESKPEKTASHEGALEAVRKAYLAISNGTYDSRVLLKDLRRHLALPFDEQDAAFFEMIRSGEADFYPEDDPMSRDEDDDKSALLIADRRRHLLYLHRGHRK